VRIELSLPTPRKRKSPMLQRARSMGPVAFPSSGRAIPPGHFHAAKQLIPRLFFLRRLGRRLLLRGLLPLLQLLLLLGVLLRQLLSLLLVLLF
jgi:hypothetical protein